MNKLIDVIRTALNEVACEDLPSGCDDLSVEIDNNNLGNHEPMVSQVKNIYSKVMGSEKED